MKQTAVEWLNSELQDRMEFIHDIEKLITIRIMEGDYIKLIKQAKQMEAEQSKAIPELSDEEIEKLTTKKYYELQKNRRTLHRCSWVNGMKMYREQLKNNNETK